MADAEYVDGLHPEALKLANAVSEHNDINDTVWLDDSSTTLAEHMTGVFAAHDALMESVRWLKLRSSTLDTAAQAIDCHPSRIAECVVEIVEGRKKVEEVSEQRRKLLAILKAGLSGAENDFSDLPAKLKEWRGRRKALAANDISLAKENTRLERTNRIYLKIIGRQLDELEGFRDDY